MSWTLSSFPSSTGLSNFDFTVSGTCAFISSKIVGIAAPVCDLSSERALHERGANLKRGREAKLFKGE